MPESADLQRYKREQHDYIKRAAPIFAKAAIGDFSHDVDIPAGDHDLTVFLVGVQIMLDAIREKNKESAAHLARLNETNSELEHEKALYHGIISSIAEGLIVVDRGERITLINQAATDILGLSAASVIGLNYYDVIVSKDANGQLIPPEKRPLRKALNTGKQQATSLKDGLQYVKSNGTVIPVSITASPVKLGNTIIGGASTFRDISVETQLDRTKDEIISIVSHQLRTPLTAVKWLSESLLTPVGNFGAAKRRHYLRQIHASNERMITLVNDLLNVSRLELGKMTPVLTLVNLHELVGTVAKDLEPQSSRKKLIVKQKIGPNTQWIVTDPRHLQLILQNLLSNAVRYTPNRKHILLTIRKRQKQLYIAVQDEGLGIPAAQQKKIFTKLFRADNARAVVSDGSGLGLYAAKTMVEQLGGSISFISAEDKGTTFEVVLPWRELHEVKKTTPSTSGSRHRAFRST